MIRNRSKISLKNICPSFSQFHNTWNPTPTVWTSSKKDKKIMFKSVQKSQQ